MNVNLYQYLPQNIISISPGRQVLSNHGSSGPYSRNMTNHPLPGMVCIELASLPGGGFGPKYTSTELSGLMTIPFLWLPALGNCWSVCSITLGGDVMRTDTGHLHR